ncbi:hypothetical protein AB0L00_10870 [Actinoallomurus sp. NPDC052308]|uniref:hypothetical protein n=1 Tax=Actinoallomurus sp. NPDC052308 TaxID=3155530 RepID=UPI00343A0CBF
MGRQNRPLPPNYGVELRKLQKRSKEDLRKQVAFAVFFFTAFFLVPGMATFTSGASPRISVQLLPVWGMLFVIIGLMVAADVLAVMSMNGSGDERRKNRLSLIAFCLLVASYVLIAVIGTVYT